MIFGQAAAIKSAHDFAIFASGRIAPVRRKSGVEIQGTDNKWRERHL
jgi:hypothetical protein